MTPEREYVLVRVAKLYYDLERTQGEIADSQGLTRWQVGRLLREARELGIVDIAVTALSPRRPAVETKLQTRFQLLEAVVVPTEIDDDAIVRHSISRAAAHYLSSLEPRPVSIGVSWGRTMASVARLVAPNWNIGAEVVLLNGFTSRYGVTSPVSNVAERLADKAPGTATLLPVPAILGNENTRRALEADPMVYEVLRVAEETPVACFGMGELSKNSVLYGSGYLNDDDIERLGKRGAVGDILGRFIDANGRIADEELDARTVGLELPLLKEKRLSIGVAGGRAKRKVVKTALLAGYVNVLITDEATANYLLEESG